MERTFEAVLVEQCAPTLAGVKPASLFHWRQEEGPGRLLRGWKERLAPYGLSLWLLRRCPGTGDLLLFLCRDRWLEEILGRPEIRVFLRHQGYPDGEGERGMLLQLCRRLCRGEEFPHEIGVFLGYPLEDVEGFIRHRGRECTLCGCWKCYGDPERARRRFDRYHRCTEECCRRYRLGTPVTDLIAAG